MHPHVRQTALTGILNATGKPGHPFASLAELAAAFQDTNLTHEARTAIGLCLQSLMDSCYPPSQALPQVDYLVGIGGPGKFILTSALSGRKNPEAKNLKAFSTYSEEDFPTIFQHVTAGNTQDRIILALETFTTSAHTLLSIADHVRAQGCLLPCAITIAVASVEISSKLKENNITLLPLFTPDELLPQKAAA
ncbi:MAG: hypothetical protein GC129_04875 [Proteobacteria bacterium]|nr:hypothetical protein [Pseudomonadota bacterium]